MHAMPDPTLSGSVKPDTASSNGGSSSNSTSAGRWLVKLPKAARVDHLADLNADLIRDGMPSRHRRVLLAAARLAVTFGIGVAATLAWQPYGDAARMMVASASPQLGWLAPPVARAAAAASAPQQLQPHNAAISDLDTVRERIDRLAVSQEQTTRAVALLTASQERIVEEIAKVREVEQYLLYRSSYRGEGAAPSTPQPATASAHKPSRRLSSAAH
jgi:hypothetical protein